MLQAKQVEEEYNKLLNAKDKPIREKASVQSHLKWQKAVNDLALSQGLLKISIDEKIKGALGYSKETTFFVGNSEIVKSETQLAPISNSFLPDMAE